jgi:hypothetical protein
MAMVQVEKSVGRGEVHHRGAEDAEEAQREEITESRFEISDLLI